MAASRLSGLVLCAVLACHGSDDARHELIDLPQLALTEEIRVGQSEDPNRGLSSVWALDVADDGTMYIVDGQEGHARVFSPTGDLVTTIGRNGQGPGELTQPDGIGVLGDTVWMSDPGNRRITFFRRDGTLVSSIPAPGVAVGTGTPNVSVRAALPRRDHTTISRPHTTSYQVDAPSDSARVPRLRFDTLGVVIDTLSWSMQHQLKAKLMRLGSAWAPIRPLEYPSFPIETARLFFANKDGTVPPGAEDAVRAALEFPSFMPLVARVIAGRDGTIWMLRADGEANAPSRWIVVAPNGDVVGEVAAPRNAMLRSIVVRADRAWIPVSDESGLLSVGAYRFAAARK